MPKPFPGQSLRVGHPADPALVRELQDALIGLGLLAGPASGNFNVATDVAVRTFQARASDARGEPLTVDGIVGPITWAALFGAGTMSLAKAADHVLAQRVMDIAIAAANKPVRETSPNRGPDVDEFVRFVGLDPKGGHDWCVCFLQWCFNEATAPFGGTSPMPWRSKGLREPGAQNLWRAAKKNGTPHLTRDEAMRDPGLLRPAAIFVLDRGGGLGHVGMVVDWKDDRLVTVEGNTAPDSGGSSNGVYRRTNRRMSQIDFGFIMYC